MPMKFTKLLIAGLIISMGTAFAQTGVEDGSKYGHGEDSVSCLKNLSLYSEAYKQKNYTEAYPYWKQVFDECPASNINIYSHGEKMMAAFYKQESDIAKKEEYYQMLMKVYDQRAQYFGDHRKYPTPYIMGKKAVAMLKYKRDEPAVVKEAYVILESAARKRGVKTQPAVLITYMMNSTVMFKMDEIPAETLVNVYTTVSDIFDQKIKVTKKPETVIALKEMKNQVEAIFAKSGAANCEVIETIFGPQLADNTGNLDWLKRVNRLLAKGNCGDAELFYKSSEYLHSIEPSSSSAFGLAKMYMKTQDMDKAIGYYKEAIELEEENETKAKYHYYLSLVYMSQKNYTQVKSNALKATKLRSDWGAPHILIGKAYAATAKSYGSKEIDHKSVYWVAVDKFKRAKAVDSEAAKDANEMIVLYSQYFPNAEELFFENMKEGDAYKVGGWINENTTVRAKK